jgi:hypothetical protein
VSGSITSLGNNLIGITDGSSGWVANDLTGTAASPKDAKLASLADNGGPTQTVALLLGSPAINNGTATSGNVHLVVPTTDQRGFGRVGATDIGAFEVQGFLSAVSGSGQSTKVATSFTNALAALVTDPVGNPMSGVRVTFAPPASGASATVTGSPATTGSGGQASVTAQANTVAGSYTVTVTTSIPGIVPAGFTLTNTPGDPASVTVVSGSDQSATVATNFTRSLVAVVEDKYNNPIPNLTVTFTAPSSGASAKLTGSPAITGSDGQDSVTAAANTTAGGFTVTASVQGVTTPASFSLTNTPDKPASIAVVSGSGQAATAGTSFANPLVVVVEDKYTNPVPNVTVTFTAPTLGASASLMGSPATTDSNGQASVTATANTIAGSYTVTASTAGVTPAPTFSLNNLFVIVPTFDQTQVHHGGSTIPITIQLTNQGQNIGSSSLPLTAVSVIDPTRNTLPPPSPGDSQPGNLFTFDPTTGTYQFNLKTKGYAPGKYTLEFTIGNDPTLYSVTFLVG